MISRFLGSYPAIFGLWAISLTWFWFYPPDDVFVAVISVVALTFTQLVLRDTDEINCRLERKIDAIVEGTNADNSVLEEEQ